MKNFIFVFNEIYNNFMDKYYDSSDILNYYDLTEKEFQYLDIIYNSEQITLSDFASKSKVSKSGATQIINKFIKSEYVVKLYLKRIKEYIMDIKIKELMKKDFNKARKFAIEGMNLNWYTSNKLELYLYSKYFWYLETSKATKALGAYIDNELVGVLLVDMIMLILCF